MRRDRTDRLVPFEKSRRVIRLDKRGGKRSGYEVAANVFGIFGAACLLYCAGIAIAGFGTYFFLIWGGMGAVCIGLWALLRNRRFMEAIPRWMKTTCCVIFCMGLLLFGGVEGKILSQYNAQAAPGADYLIVLGAQWKPSGPRSFSLPKPRSSPVSSGVSTPVTAPHLFIKPTNASG